MKRALCIKCSVIPSRHAPSSFSSSKLLTTTLPGRQSSNWEEDDDCDELVRLQRAWHGSTWRPARPSPFLFLPSLSSFLPASWINAINLCVVGDERVQPENLDHEKSVDRFSGSPSRRPSSTRPMGNHLTNERVSVSGGGGEEPPKCPESLNNRRQIE